MTGRIYGYWRAAQPSKALADQPEVKAIQSFATSQGIDIELRYETDQQRPTKMGDRQMGGVLLRTIQAGDTIVVPSVGSAFDLPSDLVATVRKLSGRGASLRILGLSDLGPLGQVSELASAFVGLEQEVSRLTSELAIVQADAERRLAECTREAIRLLGDRFHEFTSGLPEIGDVREQRPEQHSGEHIGAALARRAEKLGLSQSEIGRRLDIPLSSVNRAIRLGQGSAVENISRLLWPPKPEPARDSSTPGDGSGAAVAQVFGMGGVA